MVVDVALCVQHGVERRFTVVQLNSEWNGRIVGHYAVQESD